jgi:hypothetical protein
MLNPSGCGEMLCELLLADAGDRHVAIEYDRAA